MAIEFGATAWGRDWVRIAQPTGATRPNPALPRARTLARNDRVRAAHLTPGSITATVDDRTDPDVTLAFPPWTEAQRAVATDLLSGRRAGEDLPDELHRALTGAGAPPAPGADSVSGTCSCGKYPCAHFLAVLFEVARRLDERPASALALRGVTELDTVHRATRIPIARIDPVTFYGTTAAS